MDVRVRGLRQECRDARGLVLPRLRADVLRRVPARRDGQSARELRGELETGGTEIKIMSNETKIVIKRTDGVTVTIQTREWEIRDGMLIHGADPEEWWPLARAQRIEFLEPK